MANVINKIKNGSTEYNIASTAYATCTSAESSTTKMAYIGGDTSADYGLTLTPGVTVHIKFTYTNTATSPSLCVNKSTAKPIKCYGSTSLGATPSTSWFAGETVTFTYDGEYWQMNRNIFDLETFLEKLVMLEEKMRSYGYDLSGGGGSAPGDSYFEEGYWAPIESLDQLIDGDIVIITAETSQGIYVLTALTSSTSIQGLLINGPEDGILGYEFDFPTQIGTDTEVRFIVSWGEDGLIYFQVYPGGETDPYLYNNGGSTNQAGFTTSKESAGWAITMRGDGPGVYLSNPVNNRYLACYVGSSIYWRAYPSTNSNIQASPIIIYKWVSTALT